MRGSVGAQGSGEQEEPQAPAAGTSAHVPIPAPPTESGIAKHVSPVVWFYAPDFNAEQIGKVACRAPGAGRGDTELPSSLTGGLCLTHCRAIPHQVRGERLRGGVVRQCLQGYHRTSAGLAPPELPPEKPPELAEGDTGAATAGTTALPGHRPHRLAEVRGSEALILPGARGAGGDGVAGPTPQVRSLLSAV